MNRLLISVAAAVALLPVALLTLLSLGRSWFWPRLLPAEWSLSAWTYVLGPDSGALPALALSLALAALVALLSVLLALPGARALAWAEFPGKRPLLFLFLLPVLSPPLAAAMGLHAVFLHLGLHDSFVGVLLVHLVPAVPYAILMLTGAFAQVDPALEEQARTLGATPLQAFIRVTLRLIAPGAAVAAAFAFLVSWSQYLLTLLIGGGRVVTLPLALVNFLNAGDQSIGAAIALLYLLPAVAVFASVARLLRPHS